MFWGVSTPKPAMNSVGQFQSNNQPEEWFPDHALPRAMNSPSKFSQDSISFDYPKGEDQCCCPIQSTPDKLDPPR